MVFHVSRAMFIMMDDAGSVCRIHSLARCTLAVACGLGETTGDESQGGAHQLVSNEPQTAGAD